MRTTTRLFSAVLAAVMIFSMLSVAAVFADDIGAVTVKAVNTAADEGSTTALVDVYLTGLGTYGCCSCKFKVTVDNGATIADCDFAPLVGNLASHMLDDDKTVSYMWVGGDANAVYSDTLIMTLTVSLPAALKDGDSVNVTVIPSSDPDDFLVCDHDNGVGANGVNAKISVVRDLDNVLKLKAEDVNVNIGDKTASVGVFLENVKDTVGASSCKFTLSVPGAKVTAFESCSLGGNVSYNVIGDNMAFAWVGGESNAVYEDTLVARFSVELPNSAKVGDVFEVGVIVDLDRENYLDAAGNVGLGALSEPGSISIIDANSFMVEAQSIETEIGLSDFEVEIRAKDIPEDGTYVCYFVARSDSADAVSVIPADLGGVSVQNIKDGQAMFMWANIAGAKDPSQRIYENTLLATVTFKLKENVKAGDEIVIIIECEGDDGDLFEGIEDEGMIEYPSYGIVKVKDHAIEHFEYKKPRLGKNGNIEYWYCPQCGRYFKDAALTEETTLNEVTLYVGDVNGDGKLNAKDVTHLMRVLIGTRTADPDFADFNGDGKVNAKDVTALMKYLTSLN